MAVSHEPFSQLERLGERWPWLCLVVGVVWSMKFWLGGGEYTYNNFFSLDIKLRAIRMSSTILFTIWEGEKKKKKNKKQKLDRGKHRVIPGVQPLLYFFFFFFFHIYLIYSL